MDQELLVRVWHLSNDALPDYIYKLAPHLQAQPNLVRFWCFPCLKSLTTTSDKPPVGTVESFAQVMFEGLDEVPYCSRKGANYGICAGCRKAKKGGCTEVSLRYTLCFRCCSDADPPRFLLPFVALSTSSSTFSSLLCATMAVVATNWATPTTSRPFSRRIP
jgi:hypothetical protein